jgi:hypothetical protein
MISDDNTSFERLTSVTLDFLNDGRLVLLFLRAQATLLDLKVRLALAETRKTYKNILVSSSTVGGLPGASTTNRTAAAIEVCRTIVVCFGISSITPDTIFEICKANLWDDLGNNIRITVAEISALCGLGSTILTGGMPLFLIPMATNVPLVVLATTRLVLMLACDVILILTRAFREATLKSVAKPDKRDVENAAIEYRKHSHEVHCRVKKGLRNFLKCFKIGQVEILLDNIIEEFKWKVLEGVEPPLQQNLGRDSDSSTAPDDADHSDDSDGSLVKESGNRCIIQ